MLGLVLVVLLLLALFGSFAVQPLLLIVVVLLLLALFGGRSGGRRWY